METRVFILKTRGHVAPGLMNMSVEFGLSNGLRDMRYPLMRIISILRRLHYPSLPSAPALCQPILLKPSGLKMVFLCCFAKTVHEAQRVGGVFAQCLLHELKNRLVYPHVYKDTSGVEVT